jgi:hypothetical protein
MAPDDQRITGISVTSTVAALKQWHADDTDERQDAEDQTQFRVLNRLLFDRFSILSSIGVIRVPLL